MKLLNVLKCVVSHPLNRAAPLAALSRFIRWQLAARLLSEAEFALPFVDGSRLLVRRGMAGATGNFYCGLFELEEMGFVRHALRAGDVFVDVGANVGSFTILAADRGAQVVAIEPITAAYAQLLANVRLNDFIAQVQAHRVGIADRPGVLKFSTHQDTVNHVLAEDKVDNAAEVQVVTLDSLLHGREPTLIKIDVEGYELPVLKGAEMALQAPSLLGVTMETNGCGARYGVSDMHIYEFMAARGFGPYVYSTAQRTVRPIDPATDGVPENTLFLKHSNLAATLERIAQADKTQLVNGAI